MTRKTMAVAVLGAMALTGAAPAAPAAADARAPKPLKQEYLKAYEAADEHGSPGRNIVRQGIESHTGKARSAKPHELRSSLAVLERMDVDAAPASTGAAGGGGGGSASPALQSIAACESGGDPSAVDASGTYRGKYQFDVGTWQAAGGSGDPAAASEAEQDRRAAQLYAQRGSAPWPVCGG